MVSILHELGSHFALALQAIAILIVAIGSVKALVDIVRNMLASRGGHVAKRLVSLDYGNWLIVGLTFQLAADVVSTSFAPTWDELGRLAVVAGIRTFLSYFLDHEMDRAHRLKRRSATPDLRA